VDKGGEKKFPLPVGERVRVRGEYSCPLDLTRSKDMFIGKIL
jgi:hypothetical protein